MGKRKKFQSIDEYCKRCGFNSVMFYDVLRRKPSLAAELKTNSKGERVLDEESMDAVGKILRAKLEEQERKARKAKIEAASAEEINSLVSENEKLKRDIKSLKCEIECLREVLAGRKAERKESIEK